MDKVARYRALLEETLTKYATLVAQQEPDEAESLVVFDEERDQYLWLQVGWSQKRRVHGVTVHARLRDGKIWIEQDWTEDGIATDLLRAGVPREDIVLAFHSPNPQAMPDVALA
jgi:hypothetical protein